MDTPNNKTQESPKKSDAENFDINGDGRVDPNEYHAVTQVRAAGLMNPERSAAVDKRVDQDLQALLTNSQKALLDAGMDLNGDNKVAMNEFRAVLGIHNKTPVDAILADADGSKNFSPKEVAVIKQDVSQNAGKGGR